MAQQRVLSKTVTKNGKTGTLNIVLQKKTPKPSNKLNPNPNLKYRGMGLASNLKSRKLG